MSDGSVGLPYRFPLNFLRGGVLPLTWTVAPGSVLPPGLAVVQGGNDVPDHLAGVPTGAGVYTFSLVCADGGGQSLTVPFTLAVSPLRVLPLVALAGMVGDPLAMSLDASGGTAPYTFTLMPWWDLPPGLGLAGGLLSGTPTRAGNYLVGIRVTDASANSVAKLFELTIDDALGSASPVQVLPSPIDVTYVQGSPDPGPVPISVSVAAGPTPYRAAVLGMTGAALSPDTGTTPDALGFDLGLSGLSAGVHTGLLVVSAPDTANRFASVPVTVTVLTPPPCTYSVMPTSGSAPASGGTGSFSVSTPAHCGWTALSSDPWITVTAGASGVGPGTISYAVASNAASTQRNGTVAVGGASYTVMQFGSACSFAISPNELSATASGGTAVVGIAASSPVCNWEATGLGALPASGVGSGSVTLTVPANGAASSQTLSATIAGQTLTVHQTGIDCIVGLSSSSASALSAGGAGTVDVTTPAGCGYTTTGVPSWLTITSGGTGTGGGTLTYAVQPNSTITQRSATVYVGGQPFTLTQAGLACSITLDASGLGSPFSVGGGAGTIQVIANNAGCTWTSSDDADWVNLVPYSSAGSGAVIVSVNSNAASTLPRTAHVTIGGQSVMLTQSGTTCSYNLQTSTGTAPGSGGSGAVGVVAPGACTWNATSNASWLSVSSYGGVGSSDAAFTAQPNPDTSPRTGTLTVAGHTFTVTQAAAPCSMVLSGTGTTVASDGVAASFSVTGSSGACTPSAVSFASWIAVDTTYVGSDGSVTYTVLPNPQPVTRQGSVQVGDKTFVVSQLGAACAYSLNTYGAVFDRFGGLSAFFGSPSALGCTPTVGVDLPSIVLLAPTSGPVLNIFTQPYNVSPFSSSLTAVTRRARISFGGQIFVVKQTSW